MKADLHVHSRFSTRPSQWVLQKLGCPESFTDPKELYRIAKKKGMSLVTITDHNTIAGALELAHLPDAFVSEEVTTYFPEDRCKIHVLVYHIGERQHEDINRLRDNIYDLAAYLQQQRIVHAVAHPMYSINNLLSPDHFEKLLLLFQNFELNGAREQLQNETLKLIVSRLSPACLTVLADKHDLDPCLSERWPKNLIGGSDDHSSLTIARTYTEVTGVATVEGYLQGIRASMARVVGRPSGPQTMAHNLYGIAYQYYRRRLKLDRHLHKDVFLKFLDRCLGGNGDKEESLWEKLYGLVSHPRRPKVRAGGPLSIQEVMRHEGHELILKDPELMSLFKNGNGQGRDLESRWFRFINKVSNRVLVHLGNHLLEHVSGGNLLNVFTTLGSAGALYTLLAPYFIAFSMFNGDRVLADDIQQRLVPDVSARHKEWQATCVAHFTDTFYEVNGVALTLQQQVRAAFKSGRKLTVITCDAGERKPQSGVRNFRPVDVCDLPEYSELKLAYPPFLEMLNTCHEQRFTHIHSATPGPIGLAALGIARILKLPIYGTYHTSLPQYALCLTSDNSVAELMWKYVLWYYQQMDLVFVPSHATGEELRLRGLPAEKIRLFPRGIDIDRFHPDKRSTILEDRFALNGCAKLLYVGRVSKEKNLPLLADAFKAISQGRDDVCLIVVGDGPYLDEMKHTLADTPAVFTGTMDGEDLAAIYASSDLFVFPSATDTFGNVVLEAQASGLPVIVTDAGGPRENMIPGETGLLVPADDSEALLTAIRGLLSDPHRAAAMGRSARSYVAERSFQSAFEKTWELYRTPTENPPQTLAKAV